MAIKTLALKKNDMQPYYYAEVRNADGSAVDITSATIYCTMKDSAGALKIDRQTAGINISDPTNGRFEYQWQAGDTNTTGDYTLEFEINPAAGGKFTVPTNLTAKVNIVESLDAS